MKFDYRDYQREVESLIEEKVDDIAYDIKDAIKDYFTSFDEEFSSVMSCAYEDGYDEGRDAIDIDQVAVRKTLWNGLKEYSQSPNPMGLKEVLDLYTPEGFLNAFDDLMAESNKVIINVGDEVKFEDQLCVVVFVGGNECLIMDAQGELWNVEAEMLSKTGKTYSEIFSLQSALRFSEEALRENI